MLFWGFFLVLLLLKTLFLMVYLIAGELPVGKRDGPVHHQPGSG